LWEVESLDGFKNYLESATGHVSKNDYFVIDEKVAIGLPK
jgi:hypothetical protein